MIIKRGRHIFGEINEVRKGLWGVYFYFKKNIVRFGR